MKKILLPALLLTTGVALGNIIFPYSLFVAFTNPFPELYFLIITVTTIIIEFLLLRRSLPHEPLNKTIWASITMSIVSATILFVLSIVGFFILAVIRHETDENFVKILSVSFVTIVLNTLIEYWYALGFFKQTDRKKLFLIVFLANCVSFPVSFAISVYWPTIISYFAR